MPLIPTKLPDVLDYYETDDCSERYFNGSFLEYTDSKGRDRLAKISSCDNDDNVFRYWAVTLDGKNLSRNTFRKAFSEFRVIQHLPPIVFECNGVAYWGGGNGVHTNSKSSSSAQMYATSNGYNQSPMAVEVLVAYLSTIKAGSPEISSLTPEEAITAIREGELASCILSKDLFLVSNSSTRGVSAVFQGMRLNILSSQSRMVAKIEGLLL